MRYLKFHKQYIPVSYNKYSKIHVNLQVFKVKLVTLNNFGIDRHIFFRWTTIDGG